MSDVVKAIILAAAGVAAIGSLGGAFLWLIKPRLIEAIRNELQPMQAKVDETHKQVTVNHHSSETPTVLDRIDSVHSEVTDLRQEFVDHVLLSATSQGALARAQEQANERMSSLEASLGTMAEAQPALYAALEAIAKASPPPRPPEETR